MRFIILAAAVAAALTSRAQSIPDIELVPIASGFASPTHIASSHDGSGRLFVVEQAGTIRVLDRSPAQSHKIFLGIKSRVVSGGEMGLLSVAFHPGFKSNRRLFVNYTTGNTKELFTHLSEFRATPDLRIVNAMTERTVMKFAQPYPNHNGGQLQFGPDGMLYVGNGDGGSGNDPRNHAQRLDTILGKILRINVDARDAGKRYSVPPDNPFTGTPGARGEIFAYGLRNPWRFSFDRESGVLFAGDVGQNAREEIDVIQKGRNYGWRIAEGTICTPGVNPNCDMTGLEPPVIDYGRDLGVSVTGGYVYRGPSSPTLQGVYLYADFGSGRIWGLRWFNGQLLEQRLLLESQLPISSFGEDDEGELYVTSYDGRIYQVRALQE